MRARAAAATAEATDTRVVAMPEQRNDRSTIEANILREFTRSQIAQAIVYMPNGCYTLAVNAHHWRTFGSQLPAPQPNAITQLLLQTQEPVPGALWHCKQIRAIDALRRSHCSLEIAYDQLQSQPITRNIEFVRVRTTDDARVYQVWIITAFLVQPNNEHLMLVRLTPVRDVTVHVLTLDATTYERITKASVHRVGEIWLPYDATPIREHEAAEYFDMDRQLERAEIDCRIGHTSHVLQFLRDAARKYQDPAKYQQRLLLEALGQGLPSAAALAHRIHSLRSRLYDAFPVMDCVRAALIDQFHAHTDLKDDEPLADAKSVEEINESWEFDEAQYENALQERAAQEQKAAQYRLIFLEQPTRALVTQLATSGPQTLEQLKIKSENLERSLDALITQRLAYEDSEYYHLTTAASAILNTAWGQAIPKE